MFGYIAINKAEMKFKDYDIYHSYYCGLCRSLKDCYGRSGQLTLSYDMTFLILLLTGLYEPETNISTERCVAHPVKKHLVRSNRFSDYAASMNLLLSYYKCKDDWDDDRKKKSFVAMKILNPKLRHARTTYPLKADLIASNLKKLSELEVKNEQNIDLMAGLFGEIMAELFAVKEDEWEMSLRHIGFFLGKFIYILDAYEDIEEDIANGNYNPLKTAFAESLNFAEDCRQLLTMMIAECCREFEKLPILLHADILRNILYSGVWCRFVQITDKRMKNKNKTGDLENDRSI